jgi:hypothetical protein
MDLLTNPKSMKAAPTNGGVRLIGGRPQGAVQFRVRDVENARSAGDFASEDLALASLKGRPDGRFSINNHRGEWCEVEVRGGNRFVRFSLMVDGSPAAFTNIDLGGRRRATV